MNIRLLTLILALLLLTTSAHAQIQCDKTMHAGASYAIGVVMVQNRPFCKWKPWKRTLFDVAVIGGGKEWYDSRHRGHSADWGDIAVDAVGAFGAEGVVWIVHKTW